MKKIAVLGYGVVGSGTVELFYKNKSIIESKYGDQLDIKYILDIREFPDSPFASKFTKDINVILNDDEVTIVAEVMGGLHPAYEFVCACLKKGKSAVTSNKELVAAKGAELLQIARDNNVNFYFEASVGGAIPIIRPLHQCLAANNITEIAGILNGTTNFILTKMHNEKKHYSEVLEEAQRLGYAEKDPTADVEGHDACRKICILASLAFGQHVYPEFVHTEGISKITSEDFEYAQKLGRSIKLIGRVKKLTDGRILPIVTPCMIGKDSVLSSVNDVFNAVMVEGDAIDRVMFYGRGAGKFPTASAVVADILDAAKANETSVSLTWEDCDNKGYVADYKEEVTQMFIKISNTNQDDITSTFGEVNIIDTDNNAVAFTTSSMTESTIADAIAKSCENGGKIISKIRLFDM